VAAVGADEGGAVLHVSGNAAHVLGMRGIVLATNEEH